MVASSNALLRQSYTRAVEFVKGSEQRHLTQREYLDWTLGNNPKTGKPYNERTLRKWLGGERKADKAVARAQQGGGTVNVRFEDRKGQVFSVNVGNTEGASRLDILTPKRQADLRRTAKKALKEKYVRPEGAPQPPSKPGDTPKKLKSTHGLRTLPPHLVRHAHADVAILERKKRIRRG